MAETNENGYVWRLLNRTYSELQWKVESIQSQNGHFIPQKQTYKQKQLYFKYKKVCEDRPLPYHAYIFFFKYNKHNGFKNI